MAIKTAFVTCVQLGLSCIEEIHRIGGKLNLLITLNDEQARNKSGRIYLDDFAALHHIPLLKIKSINEPEVIEALHRHDIDWLFIIGWSQIAGPEVLETPHKGCIGIHPTLLPIGRGRAAIPWAIIKGLPETGVTMFKLDRGVDTGDIIGQISIPLNNQISATELYQQVNDMHIGLISRYWNDVLNNTVTFTKQDETQATIWPTRRPEDGEIYSSMTMGEADRIIRGVTRPYPGAFYRQGDKIFRIWAARTNAHHGDIQVSDGYLTLVDFEIEDAVV